MNQNIDASKQKRKLNIGCGVDKKEGYVNLDWLEELEPDVVHNLNEYPYPFADNSFDFIEIFHILEHLEKPFEAMAELNRILAPGGELYIKVPHFSRGFTHAEHEHGFDVTFPLYFDKNFARDKFSGYFGLDLELVKMELTWSAFSRLLPELGYSKLTVSLVKGADKVLSGLANLSPFFCSRIWCFWVGGFEQIEFVFKSKK